MPFDSMYQRPDVGPGRQVLLPKGGTLVLDRAKGTVVAVHHGCLWLTLERDPRDVILVRGMQFRIDRGGRTVIVAEDDSRLRVTAPATLRDRIVTWAVGSAGRTYRRWVQRLARPFVPYF
jgi:hypothetical protein